MEPPMPQFTAVGIPVSCCAVNSCDVATVQVLVSTTDTAQ